MVDAFIREAKLKNIKTLEELNRLWAIYLDEYYHKKKHDGIAEYYESLGAAIPEEGISPLQEWNRDSRPLTFLDTAVVAEAFLHHEQRKVDKGACISFRGQRYETKPALIGYTVEISYDPANPEIITVSYPGFEPFQASPVKIGPYCDRQATLPAAMQGQVPTLPHLDRSETEQYIASHMDYSGCGQEIFTTKALDEIHKASAGIPRMINRVCEKALMYAFQNQKRLIDDYMIKFVVEHEMLGMVTS